MENEFRICDAPAPQGLAKAFIIGKDFVRNSDVALVLGDNLFYSQELGNLLQKASRRRSGATVFAYAVADLERYGVVEFDVHGRAVSLGGCYLIQPHFSN
jgi:glucose-1-phosphate thymidylyltransferase